MKNHLERTTISKPPIILLAVLLFVSAQAVLAQNTLDKAGLSSSAPASAAYSLRLLSTSYPGSAIQIRRSSDNVTQNIGFTVNGDLDTAALKTFVGANSAFVSIWYDQSGNAKDLTQVTAARQPSIVTSGIINRENGVPFIKYSGVIATGTYNALYLASALTTVGHVTAVHRFVTGGDGFILGHSGAYYWHSGPATNLISSVNASASVKAGAGWTNGVSVMPVSMAWPVVLTITEVEPLLPGSLTAWDNIGTDRNGLHNTTGGGYSELIVFANQLSNGDRQTLENNEGSYFSIGLVTLPVTWLSFTAKEQGKNVLLKWQTAGERNSKEFTIQYSGDGNTWINLANQPASGNSSAINNYSYIHTTAGEGSNYYRILQTDLDGKFSYSEVKIVKFLNEHPAFTIVTSQLGNSLLQVQINQPTVLSLFNSNGKLLWKKRFDPGIQTINVSSYAKGVYFLKGNETAEKVLL